MTLHAKRCPTCGQVIPAPLPEPPPISILTVVDLIAVLSTPAPTTPTRYQIKHKIDHRWRDVYRGRDSNDWFVTYGGGRVAWETVKAAIDGGMLRETYPGLADSWTLIIQEVLRDHGALNA
jgi:hypothetical protein